MNSRRLHVGAVVALLFITSVFFGHRLPLYDGVAMPDEPYRYVKPPKDSLKTKLAPSSAQFSSSVKDGKSESDAQVATSESGSQASSYFISGMLLASAGATKISITIEPLAPDSSKPGDKTVVGNIYRFAGTSDRGSVSMVTGVDNSPAISMRLPQGHGPGATMEYRKQPGDAWKELATDRAGEDIYSAPAVGFGDYALIDIVKQPERPNDAMIPTILAITIFAVSIVVAVLLIVIRIRSKRVR